MKCCKEGKEGKEDDEKSSSIYFRVYFLDFGLSEQVDCDLTRYCGTQGFIAPEIEYDDDKYTSKVDVWSAAKVIEWLSEHTKWESKSSVVSQADVECVLSQLLVDDPSKRPTAEQALDLWKSKFDFPKWNLDLDSLSGEWSTEQSKKSVTVGFTGGLVKCN